MRTGANYSDNIIDPLLAFDVNQTWAIPSGSGTASLDTNNPYVGVSSLKLTNTDPVNDLTATNSSQSTIIPYDGEYMPSLYLRKDEALEFMTLEFQVFQNASGLAVQTFVLGSEDSDTDVDGIYKRFNTNVIYSFTKGDEITFTFTLKGKAGTLLTSTSIWIDGMMLESMNTSNMFPSEYSKPDRFKNLPNLPTADGNYQLTVSSGDYTWTEIV